MAKPEPIDRPVMRNEVATNSVGVVVQAGVVHGGLHIHSQPNLLMPRQLAGEEWSKIGLDDLPIARPR